MRHDDYEYGWWRHPAHLRSIRKAESFRFQDAIRRGNRRRMIEQVVTTASGVVLATAVVVIVYAAMRVLCK